MRIKIDTKEFDAFQVRLKQLPDNVGKNVLQNSVVSAIRIGAKEIKTAAPISDEESRSNMSQKYGHLRDNIRVRKAKSKSTTQKSAMIHTGDAFWSYINFILGNRYTAAAHNWFEEAFERVAGKMSSEIFAQANKRIDKYWSKK